jgi:lipoyl(octanoyl) transferase
MHLVRLPTTDYAEALEIQLKIVERRISRQAPDTLLLLEHPPTVTFGTRADASHLLITEKDMALLGIALHTSDRGGEATFHGPGQLVGYPILDLKTAGLSVREYVHRLEETLIDALDRFGVKGFRQDGKVGVWTDKEEKIGSIGVRVRRRVTYHGFSLNVALSLDPCDFVVSCGMPAIRQVSLNDFLKVGTDVRSVMEVIAASFSSVFGIPLERVPLMSVVD